MVALIPSKKANVTFPKFRASSEESAETESVSGSKTIAFEFEPFRDTDPPTRIIFPLKMMDLAPIKGRGIEPTTVDDVKFDLPSPANQLGSILTDSMVSSGPFGLKRCFNSIITLVRLVKSRKYHLIEIF